MEIRGTDFEFTTVSSSSPQLLSMKTTRQMRGTKGIDFFFVCLSSSASSAAFEFIRFFRFFFSSCSIFGIMYGGSRRDRKEGLKGKGKCM